jgi:hypothetical protein
MLVVVGVASLVMSNAAVTGPVTNGLKVILYGRLCPAGMVTGSDMPPTLNAEFVVLAAVTVTFAPVATRLPETDALAPTATLPTSRVDGDPPSCPTVVVPKPARGMLNVVFEAFDVMVTLPLTVPADGGLKLMVNTAVCPAKRVTGVVIPDIVKPTPVI